MCDSCLCRNRCGKDNCKNARKQSCALSYLLSLTDQALMVLDISNATNAADLTNIGINTDYLANLPHIGSSGTSDWGLAPFCGTTMGSDGLGTVGLSTSATNFASLFGNMQVGTNPTYAVYCLSGPACACATASVPLTLCTWGPANVIGSAGSQEIGIAIETVNSIRSNIVAINQYWENIQENC